MKRREFIAGLGGVMAWPLVARAQRTVPLIGFLSGAFEDTYGPVILPGFRAGLKQNGFTEGQNLTIEYGWANGQLDRLPELAAHLVARKVAAIMASGGPQAAIAAKAATEFIPIIFATGADAIQVGLVSSLSRPGGNVTGVNYISTELEAKKLQLLHDLVPGDASIAVLANPGNAQAKTQLSDALMAAKRMREQVLILDANRDEREIDAAFSRLASERARALLVVASQSFTEIREKLITLAARYAIPTIYPAREFAVAGGLASYGPSYFESHFQAGIYTGRILKGDRPADLPIWQPTRFEFVINIKTAKAMGLEIPPTVLALADEVIE
jgi:putative tryptophan/tyrosine transport system substrate-binding protein